MLADYLHRPLHENRVRVAVVLGRRCELCLAHEALAQFLPRTEDIVYACEQRRHAEGLGQIGVDSSHIGRIAVGIVAAGCQQEHREQRVVRLGLKAAHELHAVHDRHHDIADDDIEGVSLYDAERLAPVLGCQHVVVWRECPCHYLEEVGVVLDDEHGVLMLRSVIGSLGSCRVWLAGG